MEIAKVTRIGSENPNPGSYYDLKMRVGNKLLSELDPSMDITQTDDVRRSIQDLFDQILAEENVVLSRPERARLFEQIAAEIIGFGPLMPLLEDSTITAIIVLGAKNIYIERRGKIYRVPVTFENNDHVLRIIDRIVSPVGRRIDEAQPFQSARMPDGSRGTFVISLPSLIGPIIYIKKTVNTTEAIFYSAPWKEGEFFQEFSRNERIQTLLTHILQEKQNVIVISEPGVGKSSFINQLLTMRAGHGVAFRIQKTIEDDSGVHNIIDLEAVLPNVDGEGGVSCAQLWLAASRMRPNLIVHENQEDNDPLTVLNSLLSLNTWTSISGRSSAQGLENFVSLIHSHIPFLSLSDIRFCVSNSLDYAIYIAESDGNRWIASIDKIGFDNIRRDFNLTAQFHMSDLVYKEVVEQKPKEDHKFRKLLNTLSHLLSVPKASDEEVRKYSPSTVNDQYRSEREEKSEDSPDRAIDFNTILQNAHIRDILLANKNILSAKPNQLKKIGDVNISTFLEFFEQVSGAKYDQLPIHASLQTKSPTISRIEVINASNTSNLYFCRTTEQFASLADLMDEFPMEMQNNIVKLISNGARIAVTGAPGSGRTTLVNCIVDQILQSKNIVTLEVTPELRLSGKWLNTRLIQGLQTEKDKERRQINAEFILSLSPDHLILDGDYLLSLDELEQCLRTLPVIITLFGKSAAHALEALSLKFCKSLGLTLSDARLRVASVFDLVFHVERAKDGSVKILEINIMHNNGMLEKIKKGSFYDTLVTYPSVTPSETSNIVPSSISPHPLEENLFVPPAGQQSTEERNLLELLEIGNELHLKHGWAPLFDIQLKKAINDRIITRHDYELDELVDVLGFASRLPKKLFAFFANPYTNSLVIKCNREYLFWYRYATGIYEQGFLTTDDKKTLVNQFNLAFNSNKGSKGQDRSISSVQFTPWLELSRVSRPTVESEVVFMIRKCPRIPLMLSTLDTFYKVDASIIEELKEAIANQVNILIIGNTYTMPELVVESLVNNDEDDLQMGVVTQFGKIRTINSPVFKIDFSDFSRHGLWRSVQVISEEIKSSDINLLALSAYPAALHEVVNQTSGVRVVAGTSIHLDLGSLPSASDSANTFDKEFLEYLTANFDLTYQVEMLPSGIPGIRRF